MTLQEKFKQWLDTDPRLQIREVQLEVIADEFAIEFSKYVLSQIYNMTHGNKAGISIEELLEIYKKEKGL